MICFDFSRALNLGTVCFLVTNRCKWLEKIFSIVDEYLVLRFVSITKSNSGLATKEAYHKSAGVLFIIENRFWFLIILMNLIFQNFLDKWSLRRPFIFLIPTVTVIGVPKNTGSASADILKGDSSLGRWIFQKIQKNILFILKTLLFHLDLGLHLLHNQYRIQLIMNPVELLSQSLLVPLIGNFWKEETASQICTHVVQFWTKIGRPVRSLFLPIRHLVFSEQNCVACLSCKIRDKQNLSDD